MSGSLCYIAELDSTAWHPAHRLVHDNLCIHHLHGVHKRATSQRPLSDGGPDSFHRAAEEKHNDWMWQAWAPIRLPNYDPSDCLSPRVVLAPFAYPGATVSSLEPVRDGIRRLLASTPHRDGRLRFQSRLSRSLHLERSGAAKPSGLERSEMGSLFHESALALFLDVGLQDGGTALGFDPRYDASNTLISTAPFSHTYQVPLISLPYL